MKKILFLLLLTASVYSQNPSRFAKIQITGNSNSGTATKVNVQEANGEVNTQLINTAFNKNFGLNTGDVVGATTLLNQYSSTPSDWASQSYGVNQVVFYGGKQWVSKEDTVAGDVPGVSSKWENVTFESLNNSVKITGNQTKSGNLTIANNLNLAAISENTTNGYVLKNNEPFIHNFYAGTNPVTGGTGKNTFVGLNSGNFNSNNFTYASTMLGFESGMSNKNGYSNTGVGYYALRLNENGYGNTALGTFVLGNAINSDQNTSVGWHSMLYRTGGSSNTGVGVDVLKENLEGNFNTAFGTNAGANNVSGNLNVFLGYAAGFNELGSSKLYISNSSTSNPLLKGDFALNSLSLGAGTGNKVDFYGVGSIVKIDYRNHANSLIPIIHDASGHTFNLNGSSSFTLNGVGAAVGLSSGNINKFEVLVPSSTGGSGVNGIAVHDGQAQRLAVLSGVNTTSSYGWIQVTKGGVGFRPLFLNPNGGGVSIGNTTDLGTGTLNVSGNITTIAGTTANHVVTKSQLDAVAGYATSGVYTPTFVAGSNATSVVLFKSATWSRNGSIVTVRADFTCNFSAPNTTTSFTMSLPFNRASSTNMLMGTGSAGVNVAGNNVLSVICQSVNTDRVNINTLPIGGSAFSGSVVLQYSVLD